MFLKPGHRMWNPSQERVSGNVVERLPEVIKLDSGASVVFSVDAFRDNHGINNRPDMNNPAKQDKPEQEAQDHHDDAFADFAIVDLAGAAEDQTEQKCHAGLMLGLFDVVFDEEIVVRNRGECRGRAGESKAVVIASIGNVLVSGAGDDDWTRFGQGLRFASSGNVEDDGACTAAIQTCIRCGVATGHAKEKVFADVGVGLNLGMRVALAGRRGSMPAGISGDGSMGVVAVLSVAGSVALVGAIWSPVLDRGTVVAVLWGRWRQEMRGYNLRGIGREVVGRRIRVNKGNPRLIGLMVMGARGGGQRGRLMFGKARDMERRSRLGGGRICGGS